MATCPHCKHTSFSLTTEQVSGATFPTAVISCGSCGAPFAALQDQNPNATIRQEAFALSQQIAALAAEVAEIKRILRSQKP
jgi:hypothetical protein